MQRRDVAGRVVVVVAALLVVAAAITGYLRYELLDGSRFSDRATQALRDRDVRELLAREITDRAVLRANPDLLAARPLLESVTADIIGAGPFLSLYRSSVRRLHDQLLDGRSSRLELDLRDTGVLVRSALTSLRPSLARELPARNVALRPAPDAVERIAPAARTLRRASWVLLALAVAAGIGGLVLTPSRREGLRLLGVATALLALLGLLAERVGGSVLATTLGADELARGALDATYSAFLGDLGSLLLLVAAGGAVAAAIASTRGDVPEVEPILRRAWAIAGSTPRSDGLRIARALLLLAAGIGALLDPGSAIRVVAAAGGVLLVYVGAAELVRVLRRLLGPLPAAEAAPTHPRRRRPQWARALPGIAVAAIAVVGIALFTRGGGVSPPAAHAADTCLGHVELCDRRLDEIVLPATHNAMSVADQPGWYSAEQERSIPAQLAAGVRGLLIDAHYGIALKGGSVRTDLSERSERAGNKDRELYSQKLGPAGLAAIQRIRDRATGGGTPGIYLCHRFCELGATELDHALTGIRDFLLLHPGEIVVLIVEDYVTPADVVGAFRRAGLADLAYTGPPSGPFPTLREMIDDNQRVVVYAENHGGEAPWYTAGYARALQETPYTFTSASRLTSPGARATSCAPNRGTDSAPLLLMNHWVSTDPVPKISDARKVNTKAALVERARACAAVRGHLPNLVAVNFYAAGDLFAAVDELNGVGR